MPILGLGVSYRRAPVSVLERLSFAEDEYAKAYHHLVGLPAVREGVIISTCNRVEVFADVEGYHEGFQALKRFLSESRDVPPEEFAEPLYSHYEERAAEHLFTVAAGLDSMVLGEPQILAQVRRAFLDAEEEGACGEALAPLFRRAIRVGRRVRAETRVGASPAAFVEAGADAAARYLDGLERRSLALVGAGEMAALALGHLSARGIGETRVLNRTPERAERLATQFGARHGGLDELDAALERAELVVSATAATGVVVSRDQVDRAVGRSGRRLFVLDLAVPRDVDPGAQGIPGVRVADIDDLRDLVAAARARIADEVSEARDIVRAETKKYVTQSRAARLAPLIAALHERGERIREAELERLSARLAGLSDREREAVEALTRGIVRTLLHDPVVELKERYGARAGETHALVLAELFGIEFLEE